jgi:hypothetical protein
VNDIMRSSRQHRNAARLALLLALATAVALFGPAILAQESQTAPKPTAKAAVDNDASASAAADLQKAVQNPVASLISVPVQNNSNFSVGPYNRTQDVLNIQPVIPANISKNWMLISRIIQPIAETTGKRNGLAAETELADVPK